jgi:RNA-dependent RNA polymerase
MNHAGFSRIHKLLAYEARPCAIQSRVAGSKGVWTLHPDEQEMVDNNDDAPRIWISDSQQKIKYPALHTRTPAGRALCIFNLVAPARVTTPARLAMLSIMNVSHNGIPTSVLKRLLEKSLKERIEPLTQWEGPYAEELLAKLIEEIGGVLGARARRAFGGQSRALGFGARYSKDEEEGVFSTAAESAHTALATPAHCDEAGGPLSIHEKIIDMLSAGFTPRDNPQLLELCKSMLTNVIESATREYHVVMPRSLEAFVVAGKVLLAC